MCLRFGLRNNATAARAGGLPARLPRGRAALARPWPRVQHVSLIGAFTPAPARVFPLKPRLQPLRSSPAAAPVAGAVWAVRARLLDHALEDARAERAKAAAERAKLDARLEAWRARRTRSAPGRTRSLTRFAMRCALLRRSSLVASRPARASTHAPRRARADALADGSRAAEAEQRALVSASCQSAGALRDARVTRLRCALQVLWSESLRGRCMPRRKGWRRI